MSKNHTDNSKWQREAIEEPVQNETENTLTKKEFTPYNVKVLAPYLNVRKGPNPSETAVSVIKRGEVRKIIDEKFGFGKLRYGAGWISLNADFVKKL